MRKHLKILSIGSAVGATALFANGALGHASTPPTSPPADAGVAIGNSPTRRQVVLGDAATAVLDTLDGQVVVVALVPHPGWLVASIQSDDDSGLEIRLSSTAGASVEFDATTEGGALGVVLDDDGFDDDGPGGDDGFDDDGFDDDGFDDDGTDDDGFDDDGTDDDGFDDDGTDDNGFDDDGFDDDGFDDDGTDDDGTDDDGTDDDGTDDDDGSDDDGSDDDDGFDDDGGDDDD